MFIKEKILKNYVEFQNICQRYNVKSLYAFGSSVTNNYDAENSDIDLLVEINDIDPVKKGEDLIGFWDSMENYFNRRVDLLTQQSIKNPYLKQSIDSTKILLYDDSRKKVFI